MYAGVTGETIHFSSSPVTFSKTTHISSHKHTIIIIIIIIIIIKICIAPFTKAAQER